jgi:hypothetical protein
MIKQILKLLKPEQKKQLMYAFEHEFEQYIELADEKFIGVNVEPVQHLQILETRGAWSYGEIKDGTES